MGFAAQQGPPPSQLDTFKMAILSIPWWGNFVLGLIGVAVAAPVGPRFGIPLDVSLAVGFVLGFALTHYIYGLIKAVFILIILVALWFALLHFDPSAAESLARFWWQMRRIALAAIP